MNKPRFKTLDEKKSRKPSFDSKKDNRRESNKEYGKENKFKPRSPRFENRREEKIDYPTEAKKSGLRSGNVKISVKGGSTKKKTGALSPRAPEKIRKNRNEEMKVYGENSCVTLFEQRPEAIVRLWATVEAAKKQGVLLSYLAENKKAYHVVDNDELTKVTGTEHHGGICLLVKKAKTFSLEGYLDIPRQRDCLVLLDNVNNAQNIGGVVRTCAFYGVQGLIVENSNALTSSAAARVAEGGLEFVKTLETKHKEIALTQLRKAGYQVVHLTANKQVPALAKTQLSSKVVFVLGETISNEVEYEEDTTVQLSFDNPLQNGLNVAVSSGVLLAQWYQQNIL